MAINSIVQTPKLNFFDIYRHNAERLFKGTTNWIIPVSQKQTLLEAIVVTFLVACIFYPTFVFLFAGIVSLFDFYTRKPLPSEKITRAIAKFERMNSDEVTECAHKIVENYTCPTSEASSTLRRELKDSTSFNENKLKSIIQENMTTIRMDTIRQSMEEQGITISSFKTNDRFKFTKKEIIEGDAAIERQKCEDAIFYRRRIPAFFQDPNNLGKRMQKIIVDAIENTTSTPSTQIYVTRIPLADTKEDLRLAKMLDENAYQQGCGR